MSIEKYNGEFTASCDKCGESLIEYSFEEAREAMKSRGWKTVKDKRGNWENICPWCQKEEVEDVFAGL